MDPATITTATVTLARGNNQIQGAVTYQGVTATFNPTNNFTANTVYTATITTGVEDLAGNAMEDEYEWIFTTGAAQDNTPPTVSSTVPADSATAVSVDVNIRAIFSEAMDPETISDATMLLNEGQNQIDGEVTYAGVTATFNPSEPLTDATEYTVTITTDVTDSSGNAMEDEYEWIFTTGHAGLNLRSAASFAVLAGSTVTNVANEGTVVSGDLGVHPGAAVTGFGDGEGVVINGAIHAGDAVAGQAKEDLTTAYNDAAGRQNAPIAVAGNLGGLTLAPGLYKSQSSLSIEAGELTLDAGGNADAVWIFQMATTLTTIAGTEVVLAGDAQAKNIYWQVGSSATLGTNSIFKGTIMAEAAVTLTTGATLDGRALARSAAVSLDTNHVTVPAE
jgi:hypothetical protein